jgi:hypothetical protein
LNLLSFQRHTGYFLVFALFFVNPIILSASPQLQVVGNQIVAPANAGCTVRLQGVNADGMEFDASGAQGPPGQGITATVAEAVTAWQANIVRIPMNQDWWFGCGGGGTNGANYQAIIDSIVNYCSANNAYALLDLHWSGNQTGATPPCGTGWGSDQSINDGGSRQQFMPDDNSVTFWSSVAAHYANNPAVLFDMYNEPFDYNSGGWSVWLNGGTNTDVCCTAVTGISVTFHTPGMQALMNAIRGAGANNIVVAGGLDYAYDLTGLAYGLCGGPCNLTDTANGHGVMYSTHIYPTKGTAPYWLPSDGDAKVSIAAVNYPVIVGEFGQGNVVNGYTPDPDTNGTWDQTLLQWMNGSNAASYKYNWTAWDMHDGSCPCLISNWSFAPTSYHGVPVSMTLATPQPTCPPTVTPTFSPTPCGYPGNTCTPTFTPTATATPPNPLVVYPNPWPDPKNPGSIISFNYQNNQAADQVELKIFTLAFRKIYEDDSLQTGQGTYTESVNLTNLNPANGLYYFVVVWKTGGHESQKVMKVLVQR